MQDTKKLTNVYVFEKKDYLSLHMKINIDNSRTKYRIAEVIITIVPVNVIRILLHSSRCILKMYLERDIFNIGESKYLYKKNSYQKAWNERNMYRYYMLSPEMKRRPNIRRKVSRKRWANIFFSDNDAFFPVIRRIWK